MLPIDGFQKLIGLAIAVCLLGLLGLLMTAPAAQHQTVTVNKTLERQLRDQARAAYLERIYQPVAELRRAGQIAEALLVLDELKRQYPQEGLGELLTGELLMERQVPRQAIEHFYNAVRLDGDFVDRKSALNRHAQLSQLVEAQLPQALERQRQNPEPGAEQQVKQLYYLQSRLAGGCE